MASSHSLRLDAHQHFWRYETSRYPWIGRGMSSLRRDFQPNDLRPLLDKAGFDGCIAVQAQTCTDETDQLLALADQYPWIRAVVGWVDLCAVDLEQTLERWTQAQVLRGFRHQIQDEPSPASCMQNPAFNHGLKTLQRQRWVYEVLVKSQDLATAAQMCQQHDQYHLVLNHLGKPDVQGGTLKDWAAGLSRMAKLPHVSCKLSGLITEAHWQQWKPAQLAPYFDTALNLFGPERLLFGSDWPVCLLAGDYTTTYALVEEALQGLSTSQQAAIWGVNACTIYGIERNSR